MATPMLNFESVTKRYGNRKAVDGLSFSVPAESVVGLLGPNGAGKSTAMKMVLGLAQATSGEINLFGCTPGSSGFADAVRRTGSHIETPALYERASARQNLEIHGAAFGIGRRDPRIAATLETVGLSDRSGDKVKNFSLGMRQRMSLATAILHEPELVILDEPTNGLDPSGVVEIREVIRSLPDRGMTALVSSHVLGEIEKTVDHVVIIRNGQLVKEGSIDSLTEGDDETLLVRMPEGQSQLGCDALNAVGYTAAVGSDGVLRVNPHGRPGSSIAHTLAQANLYPDELRSERGRSLESVFLELTDSPEEAPEPGQRASGETQGTGV
ncbi:MAG: ATP-binding cassette domain-containing protein [Actinomycetes bacterium]